MKIFYTVSVPGLILWAFGVPILALFLIKRFRKTLEDNEYHSNRKIYDDLFKRFKLRLGFLTQGYEDEHYYWEVVLLLRKTMLVLMITFLGPISAGVQALSAILFLIFSLVLQVKKTPFYD